MDLQLSGSKPRPESGRYPTISVNNNGTVVEMHQAGWFNYPLYYSVGVLDLSTNKVSWGKDTYLGDWGDHARIAINDNDDVVEVHQSEGLRQAMWYRVGKVNSSTKKINWALGKSTFFYRGRFPVVALSNEGKVVIVYQNTNFGSDTYYFVGELNPSKQSITFTGDGTRSELFPHVRAGVSQLSVAINGSKWLIVAGKGSGNKIVYKVGQLNDEKEKERSVTKIIWPQNAVIEEMPNSSYPSLGLDDEGHVISLQQTNNSITYRVGKIELDGDKLKNVAWSGDKPKDYRDGGLPVIGVSNDGKYIVEEHEANTYFEKKLLYCVCNLVPV